MAGEELKQKLASDFNEFLRDRAELVVAAMTCLAEGNEPSLHALWEEHLKKRTDDAESPA
jgi:hypothetical protein